MSNSETNLARNSVAGEALINQLQQRFAGYWRRLSAPPANDPDAAAFVDEYLATLRERAYLERTVANQYRGRYLLELIQNAVDAMHKQADHLEILENTRGSLPISAEIDDSEPDVALPQYRCRVELTPHALYVANDGQSFEADDVRGVCAMGQSTKPAGEYIGYKGLGFRAVLEICDSPEIYSGPYQFGFSAPETLALLDGEVAKPDLINLPILSVPFVRSTNNPATPSTEREVLIRLQKEGYATIVRLPLKTQPFQLYSEVREACQQLLTDQTLLFLPYITELSVAITDPGSGVVTTLTKSSRELVLKPQSLAQTVRVWQLTFRQKEILSGARAAQSQTFGTLAPVVPPQDWLLIEAHQPLAIPDPQLVLALQDATWHGVQQVGMAMALPLSRLPWGGGDVFLKRRPTPLPFFAHFPTQEGSGLGLAVNSDFYLSASRKQIEWDTAYNQWLAARLSDFICGPALEAAHYLYPDDAALVEILADNAFYNDRFGRNFRQLLDNHLAQTAFVPVGNGNYMRPTRVLWSPLEQDGVLIFRRVFRYPGPDLYYPVLQLEQIHSAATEEVSHPASNYARDDYYDDPFRRDYAYQASVYDTPSEDYYDSQPTTPTPADEPEFDYPRIRKFLSSMGVKKLSPGHLTLIYNDALLNWESGLLLTGEICAALALWYAALGRDENGVQLQRQLVEQARALRVLPTTAGGWQEPDNTAYSFVDASTAISATDFDAEKILGSGRASLLAATAPDRTILEIDPAAYDVREYTDQIRTWLKILGVN